MKCSDCGKEMTRANSCTLQRIAIEGMVYSRETSTFDSYSRCHDCGIVNAPGNIHHRGCDVERCPRCGTQLISCLCRKEDDIEEPHPCPT